MLPGGQGRKGSWNGRGGRGRQKGRGLGRGSHPAVCFLFRVWPFVVLIPGTCYRVTLLGVKDLASGIEFNSLDCLGTPRRISGQEV